MIPEIVPCYPGHIVQKCALFAVRPETYPKEVIDILISVVSVATVGLHLLGYALLKPYSNLCWDHFCQARYSATLDGAVV